MAGRQDRDWSGVRPGRRYRDWDRWRPRRDLVTAPARCPHWEWYPDQDRRCHAGRRAGAIHCGTRERGTPTQALATLVTPVALVPQPVVLFIVPQGRAPSIFRPG